MRFCVGSKPSTSASTPMISLPPAFGVAVETAAPPPLAPLDPTVVVVGTARAGDKGNGENDADDAGGGSGSGTHGFLHSCPSDDLPILNLA